MPNQKISNLTPKGSALVATDLLEVSVYNGTTYDTRSVTGANVVSGLQPTLVSGTNIKTINSTSILGSGNIVIGGGGLTVGTTAIASGTIGRILFEGTGNVVQQDSTFLFDGTNKTLTNYGKGAVTTNTSFGIGIFQNGTGAGTQNTAIGWGVANYLTSGSNNTMLGYRAGGGVLASNFTGSDNILIGAGAGLYLSSGIQNTFVGNSTGTSVTTGSYNTIIGRYTGSLAAGLAQNVILSDGAGQVALWMNGSQRVGFGYNPLTDTLGAKLDVKAQGALSTDIAFRVRNSADNANLFSVQGNNVVQLGASNINFPTLNFVSNVNPAITFLDINGSNSGIKQYYQSNGVAGSLLNESLTISKLGTPVGGNGEASRTNFINSTTNWGVYLGSASRGGFHFYFKNTEAIVEADRAFWITPDKRQLIYSKTADVVVGDVDAFALYGQDIVAGNAAPHFRTENGAIVKIYQETTAVAAATVVSGSGGVVKHDDTFDGYTVEKVVKALRNQGLLA